MQNLTEEGQIRRASSYEQELRPRTQIFPYVLLGRTVPPTQVFFKLLELYETSQARKMIFGMYVNIDKAKSRR